MPPLLLLAALVGGLPLAGSSPAAERATGDQSPAAAGSVYSGRANELRVKPPRLDESGSTIDAQLNESQWRQAALLTGFSQFSPQDGVPAQDSTEVLVWYSATAIHFGIRAFESHGAPRATLAELFDVADKTVDRWLRRARDRGLLHTWDEERHAGKIKEPS